MERPGGLLATPPPPTLQCGHAYRECPCWPLCLSLFQHIPAIACHLQPSPPRARQCQIPAHKIPIKGAPLWWTPAIHTRAFPTAQQHVLFSSLISSSPLLPVVLFVLQPCFCIHLLLSVSNTTNGTLGFTHCPKFTNHNQSYSTDMSTLSQEHVDADKPKA